MLPDKILQSDMLDILFENRNKDYGAYALRRSYNKTIAAAISVTLFIAIVFSVFQFMNYTKHKNSVTQIIMPPDNIFSKIDPVKPQPKINTPQHASTQFNQKIYSPPVIRNDNINTHTPTVDDLDRSIIGNTDIIDKDATDVVAAPADAHESTALIATPALVIKADDKPLISAEVMPEYPGGIEGLRKFMLRNLKQPDDLEPGEKITVMASFIVNKNGYIEQVKINNSGRTDLNKEVQRVINKMPLWKPGMQNGNTVAVYFNLPVTFMSEE